jgi:hypothetical protein
LEGITDHNVLQKLHLQLHIKRKVCSQHVGANLSTDNPQTSNQTVLQGAFVA